MIHTQRRAKAGVFVTLLSKSGYAMERGLNVVAMESFSRLRIIHRMAVAQLPSNVHALKTAVSTRNRWNTQLQRAELLFQGVRLELGQNGYQFFGILRDLFSNRFDVLHGAFGVAPLLGRKTQPLKGLELNKVGVALN